MSFYCIHALFVCLCGIFAIFNPLHSTFIGVENIFIFRKWHIILLLHFSFRIVYMCIFTNKFFLSFLTRKERKKERKNLCVEFFRICIEVTCMYFKLKCEIRKRIISKFILKPVATCFFAMHLLQCIYCNALLILILLKSFSKPILTFTQP